MTVTMHGQYNYNRRNSSATPYTIPVKHQHQPSASVSGPGQGQSIPGSTIQGHTGGPISASVPSLSREFVVRRISEGETGRLKEELKCEACGKGYKHISSLAKHLWEHTPEWNVTKKLLISKHQQVQLLEAASILVGMNEYASPSNSVFPEDAHTDDPKYPSPFSPSNSAETNITSTTPTPPMNLDNLEATTASTVRFNFPQPHLKNSYDISSNEFYEGANKNNFNRSHSISHYPPSHGDQNIKSPSLAGGYLDTHNETKDASKSRITTRSNSIVPPVEKDGLKSPTLSAKNNNPSTFNSPALDLNNNNDIDELEKESNESYEEESVIGKME